MARKRSGQPIVVPGRFRGVQICGSGSFGSRFDAAEHLPGHDEVGRDDRQQVGGSDPGWPRAPAAAEKEPGLTVAGVVKDECPRPVDPGAITTLLAEQQQHGMLPADPSTVFAVAFSPDGKLLASAGFDGTVRLWHVSLFAHAYAALCADAGPPTPQEWDHYAFGEPQPKVCG